MQERIDPVKLQDGTLIRHKTAGYEGQIEGTTKIQTCFTAKGKLLIKFNTKQNYQYRVVVKGESMRRIAPLEDLEIVQAIEQIMCPRCHYIFQNRPGLINKPGGRCQCGGWICPSCLTCQGTSEDIAKNGQSPCLKQRTRLVRKLALRKKKGRLVQ